MCGIAGILSTEHNNSLLKIIGIMTESMSHRGPDGNNIFQDGPMVLGHRRLAVIDKSEMSAQPMIDPSGRYVLVFNGTIYNFRELKKELTGYPFKSQGDTEVILAAYTTWGKECVKRLKGMFAFAIWDIAEQSFFLARDPLGIKPLYYTELDNGFLFSSEIRAILNTGLVEKSLNFDALQDYLHYQSVCSPKTLVNGILQLRAGHYMCWKKNSVTITSYFDIARQLVGENQVIEKDLQSDIRRLVVDAVEKRLISDFPVGIFLSGGIDSAIILAIMGRTKSRGHHAFTFSFEEKKYDEATKAEQLASAFGIDHTLFYLDQEEILNDLPAAIDVMDLPSGDGLNTYFISRKVHQFGFKVALSGLGGDELFAGYPNFKNYFRFKQHNYLWDNSYIIRKFVAACMPTLHRRWDRYNSLIKSRDLEIDSVYPVFREILSEKTINKLVSANSIGVYSDTVRKTLSENRKLINSFPFLSQYSIADYLGYTQNTLMKDTDQMAMSQSVEVRAPFFDLDLVKYMLNIKDDLKIISQKKLLTDSMRPLLKGIQLHQQKKGFVLPMDIWMRKQLRKFCQEKIENLAERNFMNKKEILQFWNNFLLQKNNIRSTDVWVLVVLENWLQKNQVDS